MNGHHADCSCQSCTIGREIGMDRALEFIGAVRSYMDTLNPETGVCVMPRESAIYSIRAHADAFLSEHAEHEGAPE